MNGELPQGWVETTVGTIGEDISYGFTAKASASLKGPRYLRITDIQNNAVDWSSVPSCTIAAKQIPKYQLRDGDLVFARTGATTGKSFLINGCPEAVFASYLIRVRSKNGVSPQFLANFFKSTSYWNQISENISGSAQPNCNATKLSSLVVPLPPLVEQRRIVAKLEKLLDQVDSCQVRLSKIPLLLKRFRQSVLAAACSGRLTADWREENSSIESVEALFTKIKDERQRRYENECRQAMSAGKRKPKHPDSNEHSRNTVTDLPDIPTTWAYFRMEELCHQVTDGTHRTPKYQTSGVPFLSVKNVRPFLVRDADIKFITEEEHRSINVRCNPDKGDILYTKIGATFGYAAANDLDYPFSIFVSLALLKPVAPFFSSAFAELVMNSEIVFNQARERVSGIGTPDLHLVEIRDFRIPLPPQFEQQEIVRRVESLFALADRIEARFAEAKKRVDSITQSILAKAFHGELVPTEFELAKAEGRSFESAEELLERIKANGGEPSKKKSEIYRDEP